MVEITIQDGKLHLEVQGWDKLFAFKSQLTIPLEHVKGARLDPGSVRGWWHGIRVPGTDLPGVITAGTFYRHGKRIFFDVHQPDNTIVIDLHDEEYDELIVEVADPNAAIQQIQAAGASR